MGTCTTNRFLALWAIISFLVAASLPKSISAQGVVEDQNPVDSIAQIPRFKSEVDSVNFILLNLARETIEATTSNERISRNATFAAALEETLLTDSLFKNDLDSVVNVSVLYDDSRSFRIATWYVPLFEGTAVFQGFFQTPTTAERNSKLFMLSDRTQQVEANLQRRLDRENWYGAYYYQLIQVQHQGRDQFALLGWKGDNPLTRKRIIEPLVVNEDGPMFGAQVFEIGDNRPFRVVFEYSRRVSMSLAYDPNYQKSMNQIVQMIIFDRLVPIHQSMTGRYDHYVPEVNVFDGLEFDQGIWRFVPDIDVRVNIDPGLRPLRRQ